jgi:hypothetical protein
LVGLLLLLGVYQPWALLAGFVLTLALRIRIVLAARAKIK